MKILITETQTLIRIQINFASKPKRLRNTTIVSNDRFNQFVELHFLHQNTFTSGFKFYHEILLYPNWTDNGYP